MKIRNYLFKKKHLFKFIRLFSLYFLSFLIISISIVSFFVLFERNNLIEDIKSKAKIHLESQKNLMLGHFDSIRSDLLFLPQLNELLSYKELNNETDRILIENEFLEFAKKKFVYDQIRYLDELGNEIIRINYNSGNPVVVEKDKLQNKADRYYFYETMFINIEDVYISQFDLNMEFNKIEQPLKPMIRFGTPVYDSRQNKKGIIIINYLGKYLLNDLEDATKNESGTYSLVNSDGFWLYNNSPEKEWGFIFSDRSEINMTKQNPLLWNQISNTTFNQVVTGEEITTSMIVVPFSGTSNIKSEKQWILLNSISYEEIGIKWSQTFFGLRYIGIIVILIDIIMAYILSTIIQQKNKLKLELKQSALYDPLTNLPNRRLLWERMENAREQSRRYKYSFAIIYIDLDGFKLINDTLGHNAGDQLLKLVGLRLVDSIRSADTVSRIGGDEFVILISQIEDIKNCNLIAGKILKELSLDYRLDSGKVNINGSIGISISDPMKDETLDELVMRADSAMYEIKETGKNNYKISL